MFTMELLFYVLFMCAVTNVCCESCTCCPNNKVPLDRWLVYFMGFTILFMSIAIICLSIAFYMIKNNRRILGINIAKELAYVRQESGQGGTICYYPKTANDTSKNDGSTLTVKSGIVEVGGLDEPETPTYTEEKNPPYIKKPIKPMPHAVDILIKAQMDGVIQGILSKQRNERGSAILRELEALANQRTKTDEKSSIFDKPEPGLATLREPDAFRNQKIRDDEKDSTFKRKKRGSATSRDLNDLTNEKTRVNKDYFFKRTSVSLEDLDAIANENRIPNEDDNLYENLSKTKHESKVEIDPKLEEKTVVDGVTDSETHIEADDQEVYDTLPNPVRCPELDVDDGYNGNLPVYDLLPRKSWDKGESNSAVLDQDTDYLLLLSNPTEEDKASYINAKLRDSH